MKIVIDIAHDDGAMVRLLNFLAREDEDLLRQNPQVPLLYARPGGRPWIRYIPEKIETWSDIWMTIRRGGEDCDALAAWRAGELRAKGWRAIEPGYSSYAAAQRLRPAFIPAQVFLRTLNHKVYHCLVRYRIEGAPRTPQDPWYYDDPSARLGMYDWRFEDAAKVETRLLGQLTQRDRMRVMWPEWGRIVRPSRVEMPTRTPNFMRPAPSVRSF